MGLFSRRKSNTNKVTLLQMRQELLDDKAVFLAIIVSLIKKHRKVLEHKFEEYLEKDDYGNSFVDAGLTNEIKHFTNDVVMPELGRSVEAGKTNYRDSILILMSNITSLADKENLPMDISYEDSEQSIVDKLLSATKSKENSLITDEMLRLFHRSNPITSANEHMIHGNVAALKLHQELSALGSIFIEKELTEPYFGEKIRSNCGASCFSAAIFNVFFVMYNNELRVHPKSQNTGRVFIGNDPYKYEEYIRDLLRDAGFTAKRTKGSGYFGVDVMASRNGKSFAIQCKLYNHTVGTKSVQEIVSGRIYYKTDFAVVVSDNSFTDAAKALARKSDVVLAHHKNLVRELEGLIPANEDELPGPSDNPRSQQPPAKKHWAAQDTDELIAVILPTIDPKI